MKHLFLTLLLATLCAATSYGQTMKALSYNASNGVVAYSGTNDLQLPSAVKFGGDTRIISSIFQFGGVDRISLEETRFVGDWTFAGTITFEAAASVRTNLGLGATWLTNANVTNFRTAIGLGAEDSPEFDDISSSSASISQIAANAIDMNGAIFWTGTNATANATATRTNLGLGGTNTVTFGKIHIPVPNATATNVPQNNWGQIVLYNGTDEFHITSGGFTYYNGTNFGTSLDAETKQFTGGDWSFSDGVVARGNIVISNQTTTNNGLLFIYRTNNEPFLGLANLIASNNTTISNETLFRVGVAEATNQSAQFGFRSTNTNGSGVAVFSVFGYNALMMVGADASTNAVIFSGGGTNNQVMTLIKSGATEFARPISFDNTTNAATTRTNLGLGLPALTNTSNVTTMRALAGSTNTNQPFNGQFEFKNATDDVYTATVSNGIILSVQQL
jgi:hypothetical protein